MKTEIYCVKFNKLIVENDIKWTMYTIGEPHIGNFVRATPKHITKYKDRVIVTFEDGAKHTFGYDPLTVEIFERPIKEEKKDAGTA